MPSSHQQRQNILSFFFQSMAIFIERQLCPEDRLRALLGYSGNVEIDPNVSGKFYYKSGINMYKQFNIYYNEGSWENAFCIYLKYDKLFFDRIKQHPEYKRIPMKAKCVNATNFRIIKPKAEHARREIFKQYRRDYISYVEEMKANKRHELAEGEIISVRLAKRSTIKVITTDTVVSPRESFKTEEEEEKSLDPDLLSENPNFEIKSEVSFNTARRITKFESRQKKTADEEEPKADASTKKTSEVKTSTMEKSTSSIYEKVAEVKTMSGESNSPSIVRKSTLKSSRVSGMTNASRSSRPVITKAGSASRSPTSSRESDLKRNPRASRKSRLSSYNRRSMHKSIPGISDESIDD